MSAPLLATIRPQLNRWLSGFEADGCDAEIDDLMAEWRARLLPGDLALFIPQEQHHEPVRLVQVLTVDAWHGICDVSYFESDGVSWDAEHLCARNFFGSDIQTMRMGSWMHS